MHPPAPDSAEASSRRRRRLAIAVLIFFTLTAYTGVINVFGPRLREYFSLTFEQYGTMTGLGSLGQTVSLLLVGLVISRFGVRRITELALGGIGGCFVLIGLGASLLSLKGKSAWPCTDCFRAFPGWPFQPSWWLSTLPRNGG